MAGGGGVSVVYMHPAGARHRKQFAAIVDRYDARQMRGLYMQHRRRLRNVEQLMHHERVRYARFAALAVLVVDWRDGRSGVAA